ncbi:MAG: Gfo/Idh/MocA family oxidoreductase [Gallionellaceae bacterium]|jgi:predicted dehydrogenase
MKNKIWLVGSGEMSQDYIKVLKALDCDFDVIGRGSESAKKCEEVTGCSVISGGLEKFLSTNPALCSHAIVSVGVEALASTTLQLINYGVQNVLVEKPAGLNHGEVEQIARISKEKSANVFVAYNRRFYASVIKAQEIIEQDGGVTSFNFEFTEWAHVIETIQKAEGVKENWFLANSTHVVDLAFYLGGKPKEICTFTSGSLDWHPAASVFSGAGVSESGALFSYQANWESAGRWSVEILTKNHRLILRPMEKLQIQKKGSVSVEFVECDYKLDEEFKPGLFLQTEKFINNVWECMCNIEYHLGMMAKYNKIANYI